ncbi:MAG: thiolase domain-containing protein [Anaerolineae bacterium]|nr:thiolase domain-containing protein [Anaerolineae bacterium]
MRDVSIIGIGQTVVGEHWDKSLRELGYYALASAMKDAKLERIDALYVGNAHSGALSNQENVGAMIADFAGLRGVEALKIEAAGASAAAAMRMGYIAVAGGLCDFVACVGVEKMTDQQPSTQEMALAMAGDGDYEAMQGLTTVSLNALLMRRYMHEHGYGKGDFAHFAVNAHANAVNNPFAMYRMNISPKQFAEAKPLSDPISMFDSSPVADGAACVILAPSALAKEFTDRPVRVRASAVATDTIGLHDRRDLLALDAAAWSAQKAYASAGIGPDDIDLFELHDGFTIMSALSLEAAGFAARGRGVGLALDGEIRLGGRIPITTMGGMKARGNPAGASGLYQIVEAALQLRGEAGANQVANARLAMTQNIGGSGATVITSILEGETWK